MTIQQEIKYIKNRIAELQEELKLLEECEEDEQHEACTYEHRPVNPATSRRQTFTPVQLRRPGTLTEM